MSGISLGLRQDLLPVVKRLLQPLGVPIHYCKGEITDISWDGPAISVYVDDAAKQPAEFIHVLRAFTPSWQVGETVLVLMDFEYWRKAPWGRRWFYRTQDIVIRSHPECFGRHSAAEVDALETSAAIFLYLAPLDIAQVERMWRVKLLIVAQRFLYSPLQRLARGR